MISVQENYNLKKHNSFSVDCKTKFFISITDDEMLPALVSSTVWKEHDRLLIGGGSNLLFRQNFDGLVVQLQTRGKKYKMIDDDYAIVEAAAGETWDDLVAYCVENNLGGIENLSLVPGHVGAAPVQNIGAYGVEIKDVLYELTAFDAEESKFIVLSNPECLFAYRDSLFKSKAAGKYIITSIKLKLRKTNHILHCSYGDIENSLAKKNISSPTIQDIRDVVCEIRKSKLPAPQDLPNAGSFFKNPIISKIHHDLLREKFPRMISFELPNGEYKLAAGWLIDNLGWKGKKIGYVGVHEKQALVLVNYKNGTGEDIYQLSENILQDVFQNYGVKLEREVKVL